GTIYGHAQWDVPLSMFSVVGLIGMSGIIINDSIVLVTTIDEYAEKRGLIPAIIDGAADRLRPVLLTTLTTVLGLTPLLFEKSAQAQFLKPTVITLVYGLGFGLVLVLLVVPALLAAQQDMAMNVRAARRAVQAKGAALPVILSGAAMVGLMASTLGAVAISGTLPAFWQTLLPSGLGASPLSAGLLLFLIGSAVIALLAYGITAFVLRSRRDHPPLQP
ncbi:MAG: AcrB/AcrD/AcrF family protein, partial [Planctomycetales bacterium]|nr:AcrB/AcrD/AcrF family protein [Planctomycetales bacterium]